MSVEFHYRPYVRSSRKTISTKIFISPKEFVCKRSTERKKKGQG